MSDHDVQGSLNDRNPQPELPGEPTDSDKVEARVSCDVELASLLHQYGRLLRRTIVRACPRELGSLCDDIEQEAHVSLWKALKAGNRIAFPASYMYKVAISATLRPVRRARARREDAFPEDEPQARAPRPLLALIAPSPYTLAERQEWKRRVDDAVGRLPEKRRLAVTLHLQGLTTREIGALAGWTEQKARNLVHRGLKDLRTRLRALERPSTMARVRSRVTPPCVQPAIASH